MRKLICAVIFAVLTFAVSSCDGGREASNSSSTTTSTTTTNNNPVLSSYTATPTLLTAGSESALTVTATDADNDTLTYDYWASGGTVSGSGFSVTWTSPANTSAGNTFAVSVTVKDGKCSSGCPSSVQTFEIGTSSTIPTLSSIQTSIFTPACATASCHSGTQPPNLTNGQSYTNLVNITSSFFPSLKRVSPGEPDTSTLYTTVNGTWGGEQMPYGQPALSTADQNKIRDWIRGGAKND